MNLEENIYQRTYEDLFTVPVVYMDCRSIENHTTCSGGVPPAIIKHDPEQCYVCRSENEEF